MVGRTGSKRKEVEGKQGSKAQTKKDGQRTRRRKKGRGRVENKK